MHISRIEIENIKSHTSSSFDLARGTTAITGPNGAGKSTIVEAAAWVLFDLLEYKKEDFVRRGQKKGSVKLTLESGLDERQYTVFRDTGAAYNVTDPRLGIRIADKKEEVFRFLWQHLGLEPGTDLRSLFRQAIGVPQGTLTSIFLEGAVERKTAFDRLLKVEEYRQAADKLRETSRFLDQSVNRAREAIARSEGILLRHEELENEYRSYISLIQQIGVELAENEARQMELREGVTNLDMTERRVISLRTEFEKLKVNAEASRHGLTRLARDVEAAEAALETITVVRPVAERHLEVLEKLKDLDRQRSERDRIRGELTKIETAVVRVETDRDRLIADLESIQKAHSELAELELHVKLQEELESRLEPLRSGAADARSATVRLVTIDQELDRLRENYRDIETQIREIEISSGAAVDLGRFEERRSELTEHIADLRAALDRDEKFQSEIKNGLCPVLSQRCLNLAEGQTLQGFITTQFTEVKAHISDLERERKTLETSIIAARNASQKLSALEHHKKRLVEIAADGKRLRDERTLVEEKVKNLPGIEAEISDVESKLKRLEDPRGRLRSLKAQIEREPVVREGLSDTESNLERLNSERNILAEQMDPFLGLDQTWTELTAEREATGEAYRSLLANEAAAAALPERLEELQKEKAGYQRLEGELVRSQTDLEKAEAEYDRNLHEEHRNALRDLENAFHSSRARSESAQERSRKIEEDLAKFAEVRRALYNDLREKERLETTSEATAFIRDTLKEAAPRVARNYVYHVSLEANQLFREISGNPGQTLKWAEDYSVSLEEDGYDRPFVSLSGGEQTAAALSIRLGLLKQLTDIRIAFFDEPTANMDADRRENFGEQISRISHFDQLIVISHDDTFDNYVDHVISLG